MNALSGTDAAEEHHRRRRAGDPRLTGADREVFDRTTTGDLADEFQSALDAQLVVAPLLGGHPTDDD